MLNKPSFCCNCGEKVERVEWHLWNSRRFCELCETEFQFEEWWPRAAIGLILVFGFTGIGFHYLESDEPKIVEQYSEPVVSRPRSISSPLIRQKNLQKLDVEQSPVKASTAEDMVGPERSVPRSKKVASATEQPIEAEQEVVYCGFLTKKGTPCSRRVKGGGRCWQHR